MIVVKTIKESDLNDVVTIHEDAFKNFFLTDLGSRFLYVYYKSVMKHNDGVLLGAYNENKMLGFCAATTLSAGFNKKLVLNSLYDFIKIGINLVFRKPSSIIHLLKNFTKLDNGNFDDGIYAELLSIGVAKQVQGKGVGKQLLMELEKYLNKKKCKSLSLTTDYYNNEKAIQFYKTCGYTVMYTFTAYPDRKMYRLIKSFINI